MHLITIRKSLEIATDIQKRYSCVEREHSSIPVAKRLGMVMNTWHVPCTANRDPKNGTRI